MESTTSSCPNADLSTENHGPPSASGSMPRGQRNAALGIPQSDERVRELLAALEEQRAKTAMLVEENARADAMRAEERARADALLEEVRAKTKEEKARADAMLEEVRAKAKEEKAKADAMLEEQRAKAKVERARADAMLAEAKARTEKFEAALKSTKMINGVTFCSAYRAQNNTSESSVHLDPTAPKVNVIESKVAPVELPPEFYEQFVFHNLRGDEPCCNESNFKSLFQQMMNDVQNGLLQIGWIRPEDALWVTELALAGACTDIAVTMRSSRLICGVVEMKKHDADRMPDIFGSESMGVGQMHSQLVLCSSGLRGPGFAALSTLNAFRIFSNEDLTASVESLRATGKAESPQPREKSTEMNDLPFQCYAMQTVSLGELDIPKNDLYSRNKEYIEMLATFLLLMVQSGKQGPRVLDHLVPLEAAVVRKFDFSNGTLTTEHVEYKGGINYLEYPTKSDTVFHVWTQIGRGSAGACCLATAVSKKRKFECTNTNPRTGSPRKVSVPKTMAETAGVPCALKIYHLPDEKWIGFEEYDEARARIKEWATTEANNWNAIYKDEQWNFVKAYTTPSYTVLVMPYFHMPSKDERLVLLGFDSMEPEQSLLWKGLSRFAQTGWKHDDLKWRHVGVSRNAKSEPLDVFLIDLGSVSVLSPDNVLAWVSQSYNDLKSAC